MGREKSSSAEEEDFIYAVTAIPVQVNGMFQNTAGLSCHSGSDAAGWGTEV